jgi:hypothetical protein
VNRAERRAAARAGRWADVPKQLRQMSELDRVLSLHDRAQLKRAAARIDAGEPPLRVMASIAKTLRNVKRATTPRSTR